MSVVARTIHVGEFRSGFRAPCLVHPCCRHVRAASRQYAQSCRSGQREMSAHIHVMPTFFHGTTCEPATPPASSRCRPRWPGREAARRVRRAARRVQGRGQALRTPLDLWPARGRRRLRPPGALPRGHVQPLPHRPVGGAMSRAGWIGGPAPELLRRVTAAVADAVRSESHLRRCERDLRRARAGRASDSL
jgi:hypothetical protein